MHRSESTDDSILLLHGIWNAKIWLTPLATALRAQGFKVTIFGYSSVRGGPELATRQLIAHLQQASPLHVIGHSLGGLIGMEALRQRPDLPVRRMVCLGSPLLGSQAARSMERSAWSAALLGRSASLLKSGCQPWQGTVEVGLIAGNVARGMGRLMTRFDDESDGTVAVRETRLPGLADHCVVSASHTGLVFSRPAAMQAAHFLRQGRFLPASG